MIKSTILYCTICKIVDFYTLESYSVMQDCVKKLIYAEWNRLVSLCAHIYF